MRAGVRQWSLGRGPGSFPYEVFDAARRWLNRRLAGYLRESLPRSASPAKVLEPGSGPGSCSAFLASIPGVGLGVALDSDLSAFAAAPARPERTCVGGDLYALPFPDGAFDLVFNSSTLEHLPSFGGALREMARVTRPGGRIFVGVPCRSGPLFPARFFPDRGAAKAWVGRLFSGRELRAEGLKQGLRPLEIRHYFFRCFVGILLEKGNGSAAAEGTS